MKVTHAIAELILDRERRQATQTTACFVLLLEAFREQPSLEREGIEGRKRRRNFACARAREVGERQTAHARAGDTGQAGIARRFMGVGAEFEAAWAVWMIVHGEGAMVVVVEFSGDVSWIRGVLGDDAGSSCAQ